jgi:hypothetical protein
MMAKDPAARYQTPAEVVAAVDKRIQTDKGELVIITEIAAKRAN